MSGRVQDEVENLTLHGPSTREGLRQKTVIAFLREKAGPEKRKVTRYRYIVERLRDKRRIYLARPTKRCGFDFDVCIQGLPNREDIRYTCKEVINDLRNKLLEDPTKFRLLCKAIERVYSCDEPDLVIDDYRNLDFQTGEKSETILKIVKWMFIAQDVHYWNHSGRNILKAQLDLLIREKKMPTR